MIVKCAGGSADRHRPGGSLDHSLQEPGYSTLPGSPAASIANRLWQAVTPDPHWWTTSSGAWPKPSRTFAQGGGVEEAAICRQVVLEEPVASSGDMACAGVQRLDLSAKALAGPGIHDSQPAQALPEAGGVHLGHAWSTQRVGG